ncbi:ATP-binding protein [Pseudolabrys sp. FHR47]|uniref:ATP-binding protein n=1 Tax=Pseudolabrys sp. FHR47 TaxID=2562284 RepID=UPI0010BEB6D8|nr:ATP-binding protein [Pseudolabrys sp. FHR47]
MAKRKKAVSKARKTGARRPKRPGRMPVVRAVEAALAGIAHDIRTPLTGIVALAELLSASDLGARERGWADAIKSGADHLAQIATLLVDAVRADAKGLVIRDDPFSPRLLAGSVGEALAARAGSKSVATETVIGDLPVLVLGDVLRLRTALENLADNAVKFTGEGSIKFAAGATKAPRGRLRLTFTFTDTGIGLSPAEVKRLFKPFVQANEDVARRYGGAGLGLVFVRRIARAMGGDLTVTSKRGKGSTFTLTALVAVAEAAASGEMAARDEARPSLMVLCAEDNPYGRVVMNTVLKALGHRADFVDSGEAAVKAAARGGYDAVLMDVALPDIDGLEATRRIRALPGKAGQVPVIGISGRDSPDDERAARDAGMNFYLTKPVSPSKLAEALSLTAGTKGS